MGTESHQVWRLRTDDITWREVDDEIVILDLRGSLYHSVNQVGALLWPELEAGVAKARLVDRLREVYDVDRATAETDVTAFLRALDQLHLLVAGP